MFKKRDVVCHCFYRLPMLRRVLQDLVARHEAPIDFIEHDLPTKLNQRPALVTRDSTGVRFE